MQTVERLQPSKLTAEEQARGLAALERLKAMQQALVDERGGRPFAPAWQLLQEARDAHTRERA